ncbi:MAG: cytidine deaminase [Clostridia bacterium]|nr:cytidine deaminase [Clostridia bacterium]MDD4047816.1 cytidine deaminase [Clostridia bacterium]
MGNYKGANLEYNDKLIKMAQSARENAYVPYSRFKVGAAILGGNGEIYSGCNVENASYGLTICAERAAVFSAVSQGVTSFQAIAIIADLEKPISPCGACRQVLAEFSLDMVVIMSNLKGMVVYTTVRELLPYAFTSKKLEVNNS